MPQRAYHDDPTGAPTTILELMAGARNLIDYVALKPGEEVLILTEYSTDPAVIQAIGAAAAFRGANVTVLTVQPFSAGGSDPRIPAPSVRAAWAESDVVFSCCWWGPLQTKPLFFSELPKYRARLAALHQTATAGVLATGGRLPPEIFYGIKKRVLDRTVPAEEIRVRTRQGTDVTFRKNRFDTDNGPIEKPGTWSPFPYGGVNWYPDQTDGVVAIEECTVTGIPAEPLKIHFRDNKVVEIEGGTETKDLEVFSPSGYYMRHAFIGLNPKVRYKVAPQFEREKHAGAFYFGMDALTAADRKGPGFAHCDCQFDRPTITVDGQLLVDRGYLLVLNDPSLREEARRFGDPDRLLIPNPYLW